MSLSVVVHSQVCMLIIFSHESNACHSEEVAAELNMLHLEDGQSETFNL